MVFHAAEKSDGITSRSDFMFVPQSGFSLVIYTVTWEQWAYITG